LIGSLLLVLGGFLFLILGLVQKTETLLTQVPTPTSTPLKVSESTPAASLGISGEKVLVTKVIDGDTIEIEGGRKVRLIGIDTPETVDPRRPVGCFGREASSETKGLLEGREVILVKDVSETDRFGRLLRYVYIEREDGFLFINDHLVRRGFAKASTYPPDVKFTEQFLQAEREARETKRGLWGECI